MKYYSIYFTGQAHDHVTIEQLKTNLSLLFKIDLKKIDQLFVGKPIAVKKGISLENAKKYHQALVKAGAKVVVKEIVKEAVKKVATQEKTAPKATTMEAEKTKETAKEKQLSSDKTEQLSSGLAGLINYNQDNVSTENNITEDKPAIEEVFKDEVEDEAEEGLSLSNTASLEEFSTRNTEFIEPDLSAYSISEANAGSLEEFAVKVVPVEIGDISYMDITDQNNRPLSDQSIKPKPVDLPDTDQLSLAPENTGSLEEFALDTVKLDTTDFTDLQLEDNK